MPTMTVNSVFGIKAIHSSKDESRKYNETTLTILRFHLCLNKAIILSHFEQAELMYILATFFLIVV